MDLPDNYYHCFLGNGLDAVLVGYTGSMVADKVGVDRCTWYKSDRYYPEHKLVHVAGRFPMEKPLEHAAESGWYEIAPLGRTWYDVSLPGGPRLEPLSSRQHFVPQEGSLYSQVDYGPVRAEVTTFLHATRSLLVERYVFDRQVTFTAWMAPGVWVEEGWDTQPFEQVTMQPEAARGSYDLGETHGGYYLDLRPGSREETRSEGLSRGLVARGRIFTKVFAILDDRQGDYDEAAFQQAIAPGFDRLFEEHLAFWRDYFAVSRIAIPDPQFQAFYDASLYHFKAAQNRVSGGLPVNNLRRTWSSHIFWDSYFIQRALLEADRRAEAVGGIRFFLRTRQQARRHARDEFGANGLKWDWEITHDGRKAYGALLHMKFQVHNNGSYANEFWQTYLQTGDEAILEEFFPLLKGLATFFMEGIVVPTPRGWEVGPLVGIHESPIKVKNEGASLAASIAILEHYAEAAHRLGRETEFSDRCREVAAGLRRTLDRLYNGRYFASAEGVENQNMASMAVMVPMGVIDPRDPRGVSTAQAILASDRYRGRGDGHTFYSPWASGMLATLFALQKNGETAWQVIQETRKAMCQFGGMTEVMEAGCWNMQYFCTAQAAVVIALHALLVQSRPGRVEIFPALPSAWTQCSFENLLAQGLEVSAARKDGRTTCRVRSISPRPVRTHLCCGDQETPITLAPGETYDCQW